MVYQTPTNPLFMKSIHSVYRAFLMPFFLVAAIVLFILDNLNVDIKPMLSYEFKEKAAV